MLYQALHHCGPVFGALLTLLSLAIWTMGIALLLSRRHAGAGTRARMSQLAMLSTQIGLLGSLVGMIQIFQESQDPAASLKLALGLSYWSTAFGICNATIASLFLLITSGRSPDAPNHPLV